MNEDNIKAKISLLEDVNKELHNADFIMNLLVMVKLNEDKTKIQDVNFAITANVPQDIEGSNSDSDVKYKVPTLDKFAIITMLEYIVKEIMDNEIEDAKDALRGVQYNEEDFKKYLEARRKIALNRLLSYLKYN